MTLPRPYMPLSVKLKAALILLGLGGKKIEYDHCPPLALREFNKATGKYTPDANDPRHIVPRAAEEHRKKTNRPRGPHTTVDSDRHSIDKAKRIAKGGQRAQKSYRPMKYVYHKIQSRPFNNKAAR